MQKKLHFCWLLDEWRTSREKYLHAWSQAGWACVLWHGGQLRHSPVAGVELRDAEEVIAGSAIERGFRYEAHHKNHAGCADLFRYEVLCRFGGAYADIDILPGEAGVPSLFDAEIPRFGAEFMRLWWHPEIRFITSPHAQHPLLVQIRDSAVQKTDLFIDHGGFAQCTDHQGWRTGPQQAEPHIYAYAKSLGLPSYAMLIHKAVNIETPENCNEHHIDKFPEVRRIAGLPPVGPDGPWHCS